MMFTNIAKTIIAFLMLFIFIDNNLLLVQITNQLQHGFV